MQSFKDYFYLAENIIRDPKYVFSDDMVDATIELSCLGLEELPDYSNLEVEYNFNCVSNNIINLIGSPHKVNGTFNCSSNTLLNNLVGAPSAVGGDFLCTDCTILTSLYGGPKKVGEGFYCNYNSSLKNLIGSPEIVGEDFDCTSCHLLSSFEGVPNIINGSFWAEHLVNLTTLEGAPSNVRKNFYISYSYKLKSLKGTIKTVGENYNCAHASKLTTLKDNGIEYIGRDMDLCGCYNIQEDQWQYLPIIGGILYTDKNLNRNELLTLQKLQAQGRIGKLKLTGNLEEIKDDNDPFNL